MSSESLESPISQSNPHEDIVERNSFDLALNEADNIAVVNIKMNMIATKKLVIEPLFCQRVI
ncbi:MAG: hypothetical protein FWE02_03260 [Defluviitaleaceae bacterium]|nr:hypothetical protein [Defluviitaleaceae bacterium]